MKDLCGLAALVIAVGILKADVALDQAYKNAPGLFFAAGIGAAVWLALTVFGRSKAKAVLEAEESEQAFSYRDGVVDAIFNELGVPDDAKKADVLGFFYKVKNGEIKPVDKGVNATFTNFEFKVFKDDENLYLVNIDGKHAFPLSSVGEIHTVEKRICISGWNKTESFNEGIYKQYKITADDMGYIHCKPYYILEINLPEEDLGIYIPAYDVQIFEELLEQKGGIL